GAPRPSLGRPGPEDTTCPPPALRFETSPGWSTPVGRAAPPCSGRPPMLWTLLRHHLRPYLPHVGAVIVLQLATILATLYLPSLNADIIDNGVATGDTPYIWRVGGLMLGVAMVQVITAIASVWFGARVAMGAGRDIRRSIYTRV